MDQDQVPSLFFTTEPASAVNVTVSDGVVDLWGLAESKAERKAIKVAAETTPGVRSVNDNMVVFSGGGWA